MSLGTLIVVYAAMALGNILFCYTVLGTAFIASEPLGPDGIIEMIIFEFFWLMMFWSHTYTMCSEPGYIPINFRYALDKLPAVFQ